SPPMTLDKNALEAAAKAIDPKLHRYLLEDCAAIVTAYLSARVDKLEVFAWHWEGRAKDYAFPVWAIRVSRPPAAPDNAIALVRQSDHLSAIAKVAAERDEAFKLAKKASTALVDLTPGGSEYFTHSSLLDDYFADTEQCVRVVRGQFESGHHAKIDRVDARRRAEAAEARVAELEKALDDIRELNMSAEDE